MIQTSLNGTLFAYPLITSIFPLVLVVNKPGRTNTGARKLPGHKKLLAK